MMMWLEWLIQGFGHDGDPYHGSTSKQDHGDFDFYNDKDKEGTDGDCIINANIADEEDGCGDGYQDCEQMGCAKGTHPGGC